MKAETLMHTRPFWENETLRDAAGLGVLILVICASQMWGALLGT